MNNHLKYFQGKICTIITRETNRNFRDEAIAMKKPEIYPINLMDHFLGRVIYIDTSCIVLEHPIIKTRSYFRSEHIISIIEEQELDQNNPENVKIIQEIKNKNTPKSRGKAKCPNGHVLQIPSEVIDGVEVVCPACNVEFILNTEKEEEKLAPKNNSDLVDIDMLNNLIEN